MKRKLPNLERQEKPDKTNLIPRAIIGAFASGIVYLFYHMVYAAMIRDGIVPFAVVEAVRYVTYILPAIIFAASVFPQTWQLKQLYGLIGLGSFFAPALAAVFTVAPVGSPASIAAILIIGGPIILLLSTFPITLLKWLILRSQGIIMENPAILGSRNAYKVISKINDMEILPTPLVNETMDRQQERESHKRRLQQDRD